MNGLRDVRSAVVVIKSNILETDGEMVVLDGEMVVLDGEVPFDAERAEHIGAYICSSGQIHMVCCLQNNGVVRVRKIGLE